MLESTEKGGVRNSIRNCLTVFQNDPLLSGAIAKNLLTERTDIIKPISYHRTGTAITDTDMNYLLLYLEETYGLTSEKKIATAIGIVANENGYHPIRDYLNGLSWDGTERIRTCLHHFLGADSDQYTYEALRLFLLGAIHRAFHPGCKFEVMLCLVGGQGAGKSLKPSQLSLSGGGSVLLSSALCRGYARQAAISRRFSAILSTASRGYWNIKFRLSYLPAAQWSRCQKSSLSA